MDKLTVYVTEADITKDYIGDPNNCHTRNNCPIAQAINRALAVDDGYASRKWYMSEVIDRCFNLPPIAINFIRRYDALSVDGKAVLDPFEFDIKSSDVFRLGSYLKGGK